MQCNSNLPLVSHSSPTTSWKRRAQFSHLSTIEVWRKVPSLLELKLMVGEENEELVLIVCVCVCVLSLWRGTYGGLLVLQGPRPLCKGEYHIPSLLGPAADVSTSKLWNPFLSLLRACTHTHKHTHSLLEVLSVKAGYFVLSTFDCRFHGGLVKSTSFATKNYNKQRKLETRQTFWGTADVRRHASQRGSVSTVLRGNVYKWEFTVGDCQLIPIRTAFFGHIPSPPASVDEWDALIWFQVKGSETRIGGCVG